MKLVRIDVMSRRRHSPLQADEMYGNVKVVYHPLHSSDIVHIAVIDLTPEERTAWRAISPEEKKKFTDELALFDSSLRFTGTGLQLIVPEGAYSQLNPVDNCSTNLKELEVLIDAYRL